MCLPHQGTPAKKGKKGERERENSNIVTTIAHVFHSSPAITIFFFTKLITKRNFMGKNLL